jgi:hypothetical protein
VEGENQTPKILEYDDKGEEEKEKEKFVEC